MLGWLRRGERHGPQDGLRWDWNVTVERWIAPAWKEGDDTKSSFPRGQNYSMQGIRSIGGGAGDIGYNLATSISRFLCLVIDIGDRVLHPAQDESEAKSSEEQDARTNGSCQRIVARIPCQP